MQHVEIRTLPRMQAATIAHRGPYIEIGRAFETLFGTLGARNLLGPGQRMFGIYYDDPGRSRRRSCARAPGSSPPSRCRSSRRWSR